MALPEERRDRRGRVDLFQPNSLTNEEAELLKKLRFESAWKRGYPLAILCGGVAALATKRFSTPARIALTSVGGIAGNIFGKISYLPTIQSRLLSDLPESSPLRQKIELFKKEGPAAFAENFQQIQQSDRNEDHDVVFDTGSEYGSHNMEPHDDNTATQPKKFVTYEELRERNRKGAPVAPKTDNFGSFGQILNVPSTRDDGADHEPLGGDSEIPLAKPTEKVRYNKYGDPIIE